MDNIIIKEASPEDALARIEYSKKIGAETDNLSFGAEAFRFPLKERRNILNLF